MLLQVLLGGELLAIIVQSVQRRARPKLAMAQRSTTTYTRLVLLHKSPIARIGLDGVECERHQSILFAQHLGHLVIQTSLSINSDRLSLGCCICRHAHR
jgi:hypothetical protein